MSENQRQNHLGHEMHTRGPDGRRRDKHLHDDILSGISPADEKKLREAGRKRARRDGMTEGQIKVIYGEE
jgi:hypothetical protein